MEFDGPQMLFLTVIYAVFGARFLLNFLVFSHSVLRRKVSV